MIVLQLSLSALTWRYSCPRGASNTPSDVVYPSALFLKVCQEPSPKVTSDSSRGFGYLSFSSGISSADQVGSSRICSLNPRTTTKLLPGARSCPLVSVQPLGNPIF